MLEVHRRSSVVKVGDNLEDAEDGLLTCWYAPQLDLKIHGKLAVGDNVKISLQKGVRKYFIVDVSLRKSKFSRPGPKDRINKELVLAANVEQIVLVQTFNAPKFNPGILDRYLLVAHYSDLPIVLVMNKVDLKEEELEELEEYRELLEDIIYTSAMEEIGLEDLKGILRPGLNVVTGQSGVGKSSLIQKIVPGLNLRTTEVREKDGKGRHTTTSSSLYAVHDDAWVIDTPGIRELGLWKLPKDILPVIFPGFDKYVDQCKFTNCCHDHEPGCAIKEAVEAGEFSEQRYANYLRIYDSL